jgi:putative sporulation protein YtxC
MQMYDGTYNITEGRVRVVKLLSVGLNGTTDELRERLQSDCKTLAQDGFRVAINEFDRGHYRFLGCNIMEGELSFRNYERIKNLIKHYAAKILAEFIVVGEEKKIVSKIIEQNYNYFTGEERQIIYENALQLLNCNSGVVDEFGFNTRLNKIFYKISEYLDTHHELVLEGFINFRLKDYRNKLLKTVDKAVDDYMQAMEYKEFIKVLRYFVDVQEPKIEEVHVVIAGANTYKILDSQGQAINNQYLENYVFQTDEEINYEDLLITALITIAPYNVMVHISDKAVSAVKSAVETIQSIFDGRVIFCCGCEICNQEH